MKNFGREIEQREIDRLGHSALIEGYIQDMMENKKGNERLETAIQYLICNYPDFNLTLDTYNQVIGQYATTMDVLHDPKKSANMPYAPAMADALGKIRNLIDDGIRSRFKDADTISRREMYDCVAHQQKMCELSNKKEINDECKRINGSIGYTYEDLSHYMINTSDDVLLRNQPVKEQGREK